MAKDDRNDSEKKKDHREDDPGPPVIVGDDTSCTALEDKEEEVELHHKKKNQQQEQAGGSSSSSSSVVRYGTATILPRKAGLGLGVQQQQQQQRQQKKTTTSTPGVEVVRYATTMSRKAGLRGRTSNSSSGTPGEEEEEVDVDDFYSSPPPPGKTTSGADAGHRKAGLSSRNSAMKVAGAVAVVRYGTTMTRKAGLSTAIAAATNSSREVDVEAHSSHSRQHKAGLSRNNRPTQTTAAANQISIPIRYGTTMTRKAGLSTATVAGSRREVDVDTYDTNYNSTTAARSDEAADNNRLVDEMDVDDYYYGTHTAPAAVYDDDSTAPVERDDSNRNNNDDDHSAPPQQQSLSFIVRDENLVEAMPVEDNDDENPPNMEAAQPYDLEAARRKKIQQTKQQRKYILKIISCWAMVCIVFVGIILGIVLNDNDNNNAPDPSPSPTNSLSWSDVPSSAPTAMLLEELLPESTKQRIRLFPGSPQQLAYLWLLDEEESMMTANTMNTSITNMTNDDNDYHINNEPRRTPQQMLQRFVMATVYYATGGHRDSWNYNNYWLSHDVSECLWYSSADVMVVVNYTSGETTLRENPNRTVQAITGGYVTTTGIVFVDVPTNPLLVEQQGDKEEDLMEKYNLSTRPPQLTQQFSCDVETETILENLLLSRNNLQAPPPSLSLSETNATTAVNAAASVASFLPDEVFALLPSLKRLHLDRSDFRGAATIPTEIGTLTLLESLALSSSGIGGTLPSELGLLTKLTYLSLHNNYPYLHGPLPSELGMLTELEIFVAGNNSLNGTIPSNLGQLSNISMVDISKNSLVGPIPIQLGNMSSVRMLFLDENLLSGTLPTTEIRRMKKLMLLHLQHNQLTGTLGSMANPNPKEIGPLIAELDLGYNLLSGTIPSQVVEILALGPSIRFSYLTMLRLNDNEITGNIPSDLGGFHFLEQLHIENNYLSGEIPVELGQLKALEVLRLHGNPLTGHVAYQIAYSTKLEEVTLNDTTVTGTVPFQLCALPRLTFDCSDETLCGCDCECSLPNPMQPFLDSISNATKELITHDPMTAQAYKWLADDPNVTAYPIDRMIQRFALAALRFGTGGLESDYDPDDILSFLYLWDNDASWLSYNVSECDWYFKSRDMDDLRPPPTVQRSTSTGTPATL